MNKKINCTSTITIVYHNDMDGRGSSAVIVDYFKKNSLKLNNEEFKPSRINLIEADYREFPSEKQIGTDNDIVFFVDYSITDKTIDRFIQTCEQNKNIVWIDHHLSSVKLLKEYGRVLDTIKNLNKYIDQGRSGAYLTYKYMHKVIGEKAEKTIPTAIKLIDDYDRFVYQYKDTTDYFKYGVDGNEDLISPISYAWGNLINGEKALLKIIKSGSIIRDYVEAVDKDYFNKYGFISEINGNTCVVLNKKCNSKAFGKEFWNYPCVVSVAFDGKYYNYSIFSNKNSNVDCEAIAKQYGGGGHLHAAGFTIDKMILTKLEG